MDLESLAARGAALVWGPGLLAVLLGTGLWFTAGSGFFPLRRMGGVFRTVGRSLFQKREGPGPTPFEAMSTALGATVGTGNIAGVSAAILTGGPGAVFWMWVGAFLGMMTKFAEAALAVAYHERGPGGFHGGAMYYIKKGLKMPILASAWCVLCIGASFGGGCMAQSGSAAEACFSVLSLPKPAAGLLIAVLTMAALFRKGGGVERVCGVLVPAMAVLYVAGSLAALAFFREHLGAAAAMIFEDAFSFRSAAGGFAGLLTADAVRVGFARGTFTNEAGIGSASIAHGVSSEPVPGVQGCWGILEVFIDTIVVCTLTALVLLAGGCATAAEAFTACFGAAGGVFLTGSTFLFALAAMIGWAYYGESALSFLTKRKSALYAYRILFCAAGVLGASIEFGAALGISDIFDGLMAFPNCVALIFLSKKVFASVKEAERAVAPSRSRRRPIRDL
ncbi:MAG TPA: amino acid carrier protein [Oscillospiraceae bacterium]|nr:sodium:alanine symporter family protein [Oscillospiraceae bacterium]HNW05080.1 amino acid carrier protein [Oscillospiraceae bacterium]